MRFQRFILYLTIITAFVGSLWGTMAVGKYHMFPYRLFVLFMWIMLSFNILQKRGRLDVSYCKVKRYFQFFAIWLGLAILSVIWAASKGDAARNIILLFIGISIVFFMVYFLRGLDHLVRMYWLWWLMFVVLIAIGIWEVITGNHLQCSRLYEDDLPRKVFAPTAVFHNENDYAAYIALSLPMILAGIWHCHALVVRVIGIPLFAAGIWVLLLTSSRSCYIATLMGLFFGFLFLLKLNKRITALISVVGLCALVFLFFPDQTRDLMQHVEGQAQSLSSGDDGGSVSIRLNLVKNAIYFTVQSLGMGVGAGNAEFYMENSAVYWVGGITNMHNWWMEILVNYGLFIFAGYLICCASIFYNLLKIRWQACDRTGIMICDGFLMGWVSFALASISSSSMMSFRPQWILFGFSLAFINYWRNKTYGV